MTQPTTLPSMSTVDMTVTLGPDAVIRCDVDPDQPPILSIRLGAVELMLTTDAEPGAVHVAVADKLVREACRFQLAITGMARRGSTPNGPPETAVWPPGRAVEG